MFAFFFNIIKFNPFLTYILTRVFQFTIKGACDSCGRSVSAAVNSDLCFSATATTVQQQWVNCRFVTENNIGSYHNQEDIN